MKAIQQDMNLLTNFTAFRDNYENLCHYSGWVICRSGQAPKSQDDKPGETHLQAEQQSGEEIVEAASHRAEVERVVHKPSGSPPRDARRARSERTG